ncbi:MAG: I78 family peptidase inhibitor [Pseudomonadota bacterium]
MHRVFPLILLFAGCSVQPGTEFPPIGTPGGCAPQVFSSFLGQPRTALVGVTINGPSRVIEPGSAVTTDFQPDRVNFEIDEAGTIARIYCG